MGLKVAVQEVLTAKKDELIKRRERGITQYRGGQELLERGGRAKRCVSEVVW